jgi:integrase
VSQAVNDSFARITDARGPRETDVAYRERLEAAKFTPHDLRRTVRSRLAALGVNSIVARKVLNHALDGMDRIYDRHAYLDEKRDALQRWTDELRAILAGADRKVVPIRAGARR